MIIIFNKYRNQINDDWFIIEQIYPSWHKPDRTNCFGNSPGNGARLVAYIDHLHSRSDGWLTGNFSIRSQRIPSWSIRRSLRFTVGSSSEFDPGLQLQMLGLIFSYLNRHRYNFCILKIMIMSEFDRIGKRWNQQFSGCYLSSFSSEWMQELPFITDTSKKSTPKYNIFQLQYSYYIFFRFQKTIIILLLFH